MARVIIPGVPATVFAFPKKIIIYFFMICLNKKNIIVQCTSKIFNNLDVMFPSKQ